MLIYLNYLARVFVLYLLRGCLIPNTLLWSLYAYWFQGPNIHLLFLLISLSLISLISFMIGVNNIIRSLNFFNILTCVGLVMKYPIMSFVGHHSIFNSFLLIRTLMKKILLICLVHLLLYYLPFFYSIMELLLSW